MPDTILHPHDSLSCESEQFDNMSDLELLEYVRRRTLHADEQNDIAHDHRRFLDRAELERLARLVQRMQTS